MRTVPAVLTVALLTAACGSDDALPTSAQPREPGTGVTDPPTTPDPLPTSTEPTAPEPTPPEPTPQRTGSSTPQQLATIAIDDLATRLGAERIDIGVRSVEEVTWRDGSIGCPDPDLAYTQALVPGIRVVLDHDGFAYHYHQGGGRDLFYCPRPAAPIETSALD